MGNTSYIDIDKLKQMKNELTKFMLVYKFALEEMMTKINILEQELHHTHDYNPIEHVNSRIKSPESIFNKIRRKSYPLSLPAIQNTIKDIAGIRITCSFVSDIYKIADMISSQADIEVIDKKDYIKNPKGNGYRSFHLIIKIPVFMSDRVEKVFVEIQIRTIAMDFWASLEHKIYYKYDKEIPDKLIRELKDAANSATELDKKMENLHIEINGIKALENSREELTELHFNDDTFPLPADLLRFLSEKMI